MSDSDLVQAMIARPGQSQADRHAPELSPEHAQVFERSPDALWEFLRAELSPAVRFHGGATGQRWDSLFTLDHDGQVSPANVSRLRALAEQGEVPAHLSLLRAFTWLHEHAREVGNRFTGRHLDFHYREVLRFEPRPPVPDRVHAVVQLKKGVEAARVTPTMRVSAGKGPDGGERLYAPVHSAVIRNASVTGLRSVFRDPDEQGFIRVADVANSSDGRGGELPEAEPAWPGFGAAELPLRATGFAVSGAVLRMAVAKGRALRVQVKLGDAQALPTLTMAQSTGLIARLTGPEGWLARPSPWVSVSKPSSKSSERTLEVWVQLMEDDGPIVDYDPELHGPGYASGAPVLELRLSGEVALADVKSRRGAEAKPALTPALLRACTLKDLFVVVSAEGLPPEGLSNDGGGLKPDKAGQAFGPRPSARARLHVRCDEALSKQLVGLSLSLAWMDGPKDLSTWYRGYAGLGGAFTADARWRGAQGAREVTKLPLFKDGDATQAATMTLQMLSFPLGEPSPTEPASTAPSAITLELNQGFGHDQYTALYVKAVTLYANKGEALGGLLGKSKNQPAPNGPVLPNEPYAPVLRELSLSYTAHAKAEGLTQVKEGPRALRFYHLGPFGAREEHAGRHTPSGQAAVTPPLLPETPDASALLIGLGGVGPGDSVSLLFRVSEGSADPDKAGASLRWSVLSQGRWRALGPDELALDTTRGLLRSGVVQLVLPRETSTEHSWMPAGQVWLKAGLQVAPDAVCELIEVATNGLELELQDPERAPLHLSAPLPAGSLKGFKPPMSGVKALSQPYASFGGSPTEDQRALRARAAERLRHRGRAITPWDIERVVLEAFPKVHRVKCLPHSKPGDWRAPGHITLILVPDLRNENARDPLRPKVPADTVAAIQELLAERVGPGVTLHVRNPRYAQVSARMGVRFRPGLDFNQNRALLQDALVRALSPWAFDARAELSFGAEVYRSQLLHMVEEIESVDYVTQFELSRLSERGARGEDAHVLRPDRPDTVLVSAPAHDIFEAKVSSGATPRGSAGS
ncbi:MAG: baseplate J/gp47 family protein [Alphaproteobacteria bacterium]|nr:baseplate J/gp47 family protein [Alphaproteobacteria bacterium]MCB9795345.1 baseplate J/gp47 family protein [Alphaproteobacteria bacterium]